MKPPSKSWGGSLRPRPEFFHCKPRSGRNENITVSTQIRRNPCATEKLQNTAEPRWRRKTCRSKTFLRSQACKASSPHAAGPVILTKPWGAARHCKINILLEVDGFNISKYKLHTTNSLFMPWSFQVRWIEAPRPSLALDAVERWPCLRPPRNNQIINCSDLLHQSFGLCRRLVQTLQLLPGSDPPSRSDTISQLILQHLCMRRHLCTAVCIRDVLGDWNQLKPRHWLFCKGCPCKLRRCQLCCTLWEDVYCVIHS